MSHFSIFGIRSNRIAVYGALASALGIASGSSIAAPCVSGVPYTTVGANDCQVPAGVTSISVSATGAGGGGGVGKAGAEEEEAASLRERISPLRSHPMEERFRPMAVMDPSP